MKDKRVWILLTILFLYIVIALAISFFDRTRNFMIINDEYFYKFQNNVIYNIDDTDKRLLTNQFIVYSYEILPYTFNYTKQRIDGRISYTYGEAKEQKLLKLPYIAVSGNIGLINFDINDFDETDIVNLKNVLLTEGKNTDFILLHNGKTTIDLNNDGTNETVYFATGSYVNSLNVFAIIYVQNESGYKILESSYQIKKGEFSPSHSLSFVIDINKDKNYEMIVLDTNDDESDYSFYEYKNGSYQKMTEE